MKSCKNKTLNVSTVKTTGQLNIENKTHLGLFHNGRDKKSQKEYPPDSYLQNGNTISNQYNTSSDFPIEYSPTSEDQEETLITNPDTIANDPIVAIYPWLNPQLQDKSTATQNILASNDRPVSKCLGKGKGKVLFFRSGLSFDGDQTQTQNTNDISTIGLTFKGRQPLFPNTKYPYNGYLYAGQLVQLHQETIDNITRTVVIPYQQGRGVPEYSKNYYPEDQETTAEYVPYGQLTWPDGSDLQPSMASGITHGISNMCVGVVLDTQTTTIPNERLYKPSYEGTINDEEWYNRPAPQTLPPESKTQTEVVAEGFLSPGPNLSNTYYSPWPRYYAYQPGEAVPVLTEGITTLIVGATTSIALMTYGKKQTLAKNQSVWVPVPCIPLFEGERVEAGSVIYASAKGHSITPGAINQQTITDYDTESKKVVSLGTIGQTPWDPYVDSTWGNMGWTSTPGLVFNFIPDTTVPIMNVTQGETISNLNQASYGSVIISPISSVSASPSLGNAYLQSELELEDKGISSSQVQGIKEERHNLTGISGRGALSQIVPECSQPIGILLETIVGKGKWTYTSQPLGEDADLTGTLSEGGVLYADPNDINPTNVTDNVGGVGGGTVEWLTNIQDPPNLGTIQEPLTFNDPGGYAVGDIFTVIDNSLTWNTTQYHSNNACYILETDLVPSAYPSGTGYSVGSYELFNLSLNNAYLQFDQPANVEYVEGNPGSGYYQDFNRYPRGTVLRVLGSTSTSPEFDAYFQVLRYTDESNTLVLEDFSQSSTYAFGGLGYAETEQTNWDTLQGRPTIEVTTVGTNGEIEEYTITNYGNIHKEGDLLLVLGGDFNAVLSFPGYPYGIQPTLYTGPGYENEETYSTLNVDTGLASTDITIVQTDPVLTNVPLILEQDVPVGVDTTVLVYASGTYNYSFPRYHSYCLWLDLTNTSITYNNTPIYSNITTSILPTYNMSANSLRVLATVVNGTPVSISTDITLYEDPEFIFDEDRYTFDSENGTLIRLLVEYDAGLNNSTKPDFIVEIEAVFRLVEYNLLSPTGFVTELVKSGGYYGLADGDYIFQTQRLDQTNPLLAYDGDTTFTLSTTGTNNIDGDLIFVDTVANVQDAIEPRFKFIFQNNLQYIDLPPYAIRPGFNVSNDEDAWTRYSEIMESATNLFNRQVLVKLQPMSEQSDDTTRPNAVVGGPRAPPTGDPYHNDYYYEFT